MKSADTSTCVVLAACRPFELAREFMSDGGPPRGALTYWFLQTVVSTMAGKHGATPSGTAAPREKRAGALKSQSDFFTTQDLKKAALFHDIKITAE